MTLSEDEREALARATGHTSPLCVDYHCETCVATTSAVEAIIAARLAPIEAVASEWSADLDEGRIRDLDARYCWNTALNELRRALMADY